MKQFTISIILAVGIMMYTVNHISPDEAARICVRGFRNVWDETVKPPKMLPNLEFEHFVDSMILRTEGELMI